MCNFLTVALILAAACLLASCAKPDRNFALPAASEPKLELTTPADIATALVKGGYILYMRHGETIREQGEIEAANRETGRFDIDDCTTQCNLSDGGREQARASGAAYRRAGIPVARHICSRYCHALQTARLFADDVDLSKALTAEGAITKNPARIKASPTQPPDSPRRGPGPWFSNPATSNASSHASARVTGRRLHSRPLP